MNKIVVTKANNQVTGVYLSPDLIGEVQIETLDYDEVIFPSDEKIENEIDNQDLTKIA